MSEYTPDCWVVIEIAADDTKVQRILSSWYGGWAGSDSWRLSSGITEVEELEDSYIIKNESGSVYTCYKCFFHTCLLTIVITLFNSSSVIRWLFGIYIP